MTETYSEYVRGLNFLGAGSACNTVDPETRADYERARATLASLQASAQAAGGNTWQEAHARHAKARERFRAFPTPCQVTLCFHPCQRLGHGGACEECSTNVKNVMHRTCDRYGIELG